MDWKTWVNHRSGGTKLSVEEAEQYVTELILTRSIAAPSRNENEEFLCSPASLGSISRSRRVMQTLGMIVRSRHLEYYYQAVYLLQFLHGLYPNATSLQDYGKLLVYLKVEAVIYVACCSVSANKTRAAQCLVKQLFDNYKCEESCSAPDKQHLESIHDDGRSKLSQILASSDELRLSNLLEERQSSQKTHQAMCKILEGFFKGIDDVLPAPTIIQIIQDFQEQRSVQETESSVLNYVTPPVTSTQVLMRGQSLSSRQFPPLTSTSTTSAQPDLPKATDSLKIKADLPCASRDTETVSPSKPTDSVKETDLSKTTAPSSSKTATGTSETSTLTKTMASSDVIISSKAEEGSNKLLAASNDAHESTQDTTCKTTNDADTKPNVVSLPMSPDLGISNSPPKMAPISPKMTSDSLQAFNLTDDNSYDTADNNTFCELKFVSTHSCIKKAPVSPKRFVPLVKSMRCRRSLTRPNREQIKSDSGKAHLRIKRVRIVLSPLTKEECMYHLKPTTNKTRQSSTSPVQQKETQHKESGDSSSLSSMVYSTSDDDYKPLSNSDKDSTSVTTTPTRRKRKLVPPQKYATFDIGKQYQRDSHYIREKSRSPISKNSGRISIAARSHKKRKSMRPVRYAPFTRNRTYQRDQQDHNRERLHTPDSESVISESVTSSIGLDSPLVNLHT